ncbi:MAG: GNAT family N-acetyltransferase [Rikenellaceae bacterium]
MLRRKSVTSPSDNLFPFVWELYLAAFPENERRSLDYHTETMTKDKFHCDAILEGDEPVGLLFWWDLSDFVFVEHLATSPDVRGKGIGNQILSAIISESIKPILLEVEHPLDELSRRRIGFYERIGFVLNEYEYRHPSYQQKEGEFVDLLVMTHPGAITKEDLQKFKDNEFAIIHFRSFQVRKIFKIT